MPAPTPLPRGPSVLTLYSAADLLTGPGCPVCRYAAEASDRYLGWFALEGHAEAATITRMCASLGMCARHTRRLMSQPGSAVRLTAVYRYVVSAARDRLAGSPGRPTACPACEHDDAAARRALDTLLEGLADPALLRRYQDLGGLCLPHLNAAALAGRHRTVTLLAETMRETTAAPRVQCDWLVGTDRDAETRAVLRRTLSRSGSHPTTACAACLAGARGEQAALALLPGLASDGQGPALMLLLCAAHLADAATTVDRPAGVRELVAWQTACLTSRLHKSQPWPRAGLRRRHTRDDCTICTASRDAALRTLGNLARPTGGAMLCVRHHLILRTADPRAGKLLAPAAVDRAAELVGELADAFDRFTWARSRGSQAPDSGVWRYAAAFLDGAVFGGCPPRQP